MSEAKNKPEAQDLKFSGVSQEELRDRYEKASFKDLETEVYVPLQMIDMIMNMEISEELRQNMEGEDYEEICSTEVAEIAILDKIETSSESKFDFYIARRNSKHHAFKPETVLLARNKEKGNDYIANYSSFDAEEFDSVNEKRFLTDEQQEFLETVKDSETITSGDRAMSVGKKIGRRGYG